MCIIFTYYDYNAKFEIIKTGIVNEYTTNWMNKKSDSVKYISIKGRYETKSFAILYKNSDIYYLDYIYTFEFYRRNGYATRILNYIKIDNSIKTYSINEESKKLFESCNLEKINYTDDGRILYRYVC